MAGCDQRALLHGFGKSVAQCAFPQGSPVLIWCGCSHHLRTITPLPSCFLIFSRNQCHRFHPLQAQLALAWALKNPDVSTVILGATKLSQLEENLQVGVICILNTPPHTHKRTYTHRRHTHAYTHTQHTHSLTLAHTHTLHTYTHSHSHTYTNQAQTRHATCRCTVFLSRLFECSQSHDHFGPPLPRTPPRSLFTFARPSSPAPGAAGATVAGAQGGAAADGGSNGANRGRAGQRP